MKRLISYQSIQQFRSVVQNFKKRCAYIGKDENGKAKYNPLVKYPKISVTATEKIHGCFEKNTLVTLANGERIPISKLTPDVWILSYNVKTGLQEIQQVTQVINQKLNKEWCRLVFDKTTLICTRDHKIWTDNRGFVEAWHLSPEDIFVEG
jgi:hypothetical protein